MLEKYRTKLKRTRCSGDELHEPSHVLLREVFLDRFPEPFDLRRLLCVVLVFGVGLHVREVDLRESADEELQSCKLILGGERKKKNGVSMKNENWERRGREEPKPWGLLRAFRFG